MTQSTHAILNPRPQRVPHVSPGAIEPHAPDMAVVVAADVTLGSVQEMLAAIRPVPQWLPNDGDPKATLAELILHDSTGPLRIGYGGWRDRLTGAQFTDGHGDLVTVGGLPVKNVAGYDLVRFLVGSHGCFGTPVTFTLRTDRRPEAAMKAVISVAEGLLAEQVNGLLTSEVPPQWMLVDDAGLRLGWLGSMEQLQAWKAVVEPLIASSAGICAITEDMAERAAAMRWPSVNRGRLSLPPAKIEALREFAVADPAFGIAWCDADDLVSRLDEIQKLGGHGMSLRRGSEGQLLDVMIHGAGTEPPAVLGELKRRMDPTGALPSLPTYG